VLEENEIGPVVSNAFKGTIQYQPVPETEIVAKAKEEAREVGPGHIFTPDIAKLDPRSIFHQFSPEGQVVDVAVASRAMNGFLISPSMAYEALVLGETLAHLLEAAVARSIKLNKEVPSAPSTSTSEILNCPVNEDEAVMVMY